MKFSEVIEALQKGSVCTREAWDEEAKRSASCSYYQKYIVRQIPQEIASDIVPKMTSLPDAAKDLIDASGNRTIRYHDQVLCINAGPNFSSNATSYTPTWEDIFADDWQIAMPADE